MEYSLELWVIRMTLIRRRANAPKSREQNPATPTMPAP
jgi:hypothetical protein